MSRFGGAAVFVFRTIGITVGGARNALQYFIYLRIVFMATEF